MSEEFDPGAFVGRKIRELLGSDPSVLRPASRAALSQLRQASAQAPGCSPAVWPYTAEGIPSGLSPLIYRRHETAIHLALTQFALHQQARSRSMHAAGQPFGSAVRRLADATRGEGEPHETPVYRRFTSLATTTNVTGLLAHLRGIVGQLRTREIPFDYAQFTRDLYWFQVPGRALDVQRRWGRDFHRLNPLQTETTIEGAE